MGKSWGIHIIIDGNHPNADFCALSKMMLITSMSSSWRCQIRGAFDGQISQIAGVLRHIFEIGEEYWMSSNIDGRAATQC
jgi:hypothetical protein